MKTYSELTCQACWHKELADPKRESEWARVIGRTGTTTMCPKCLSERLLREAIKEDGP